MPNEHRKPTSINWSQYYAPKTLSIQFLPVLLVASVLVLRLPATTASDWLQFGGPSRNFSVFDETASTIAPVFQPWSVDVEGGDDSPLVQGDRIFITEIEIDSNGAQGHYLTCRSLATGEIIWRSGWTEPSYSEQDVSDKYPVRPLATSCIVDDHLITVGYGGTVRCWNTANGRQEWMHDLVQEFQAIPIQYGAATSPWSDGQRVVIACGGPQALLISFLVADGSVAWKSGSGVASYASLVELEIPNFDPSVGFEKHLVYAGGDAVLGFESSSGRILWTYAYPKSGLTNTVNPIAVEQGCLLIGGQGVGGSSLLRVSQDREANGSYRVDTLWTNTRIQPFYCNWVYDASQRMVIGFAGKTLFGLDRDNGTTLWQKRGFTDANLALTRDGAIAVRGDGVAARATVNRESIQVHAAQRVVTDRIWSPPVLVDGRLLVRGRSTLTCVDWKELPTADAMPSGTAVTSMEAMYGSRSERIIALLDLAKGTPKDMAWEDYAEVVNDRSLGWDDGDFAPLLKSLEERDQIELGRRISDDWVRRSPNSIVAWEQNFRWLEKTGDTEEAVEKRRDRMAVVRFEVSVPEATPPDFALYVTGNASALGPWQPDGLQLTRGDDGKYRVALECIRGDLQFKITRGTWESVEVDTSGKPIANRVQRLDGETTIRLIVSRWKDVER